MNNNPNDYKHCIPINRIEMWILRIAFTIGYIALGFSLGLLYKENSFENGASYMQRAYTNGGLVERVVITGNSTRKEIEKR